MELNRLEAEKGVIGSCLHDPTLANKVDLKLIADVDYRRCLRVMQDNELDYADGAPLAIALKLGDGAILKLLNPIQTAVETSAGFGMFLKALEADPFESGFGAHYDVATKAYWIQSECGGWIPVNDSPLKLHMKKAGIHTDSQKIKAIEKEVPGAEDWITVEDEICRIQTESHVRYAGPLAGHWAGLHRDGTYQILVTESPRLVEPKKGSPSLLSQVCKGLLTDGDDDTQLLYFFGWLKVAQEALRTRKKMPGQALVLAGPKDCGKSLLQWIITECLGGRSAKPYRYMSGLTTFNSDLFEAEHLMIEDESTSTDIRKRRALGSEIKAIAVNETHSHHGKHKNALTLRPFWRLSISVNDEPENLMILPPLDESIADKLILLKASRFKMPMPTETPEEREKFNRAMKGEIPAFLYALDQWQISDEMKDRRFGVRYYHHPQLLEALDVMAPETRLLELMDDTLEFGAMSNEWVGTAQQLEHRLRGSDYGHEASRIFTFSTAAGTYLGRLAVKHPERVEHVRTGSSRKWRIRKELMTA